MAKMNQQFTPYYGPDSSPSKGAGSAPQGKKEASQEAATSDWLAMMRKKKKEAEKAGAKPWRPNREAAMAFNMGMQQQKDPDNSEQKVDPLFLAGGPAPASAPAGVPARTNRFANKVQSTNGNFVHVDEDTPENVQFPLISMARLISTEDPALAAFLGQFVYPWQALEHIGEFLEGEIKKLTDHEYYFLDNQVCIHKTAIVYPNTCIEGPCIIQKNCVVRHGAFIRGNVYAGEKSILGNSCEFKNSILCEHVQTPHFNYVGDSILGPYAHFGAGVITSNIKSDQSIVCVRVNYNLVNTNLRKFGAAVGNHVEVGCNTVINPGSIICPNSRVYPLSSVRSIIPPNSIYKKEGVVVPLHS